MTASAPGGAVAADSSCELPEQVPGGSQNGAAESQPDVAEDGGQQDAARLVQRSPSRRRPAEPPPGRGAIADAGAGGQLLYADEADEEQEAPSEERPALVDDDWREQDTPDDPGVLQYAEDDPATLAGLTQHPPQRGDEGAAAAQDRTDGALKLVLDPVAYA